MSAVEPVSIVEAAEQAYAARSELDLNAAVQSLRTQIRTKLKINRDAYHVDVDEYEDSWTASFKIGATIDGVSLCLDKTGALAVVNWACSHKDCPLIRREPIKDYATLGMALVKGEWLQRVQPKCEAHASQASRFTR